MRYDDDKVSSVEDRHVENTSAYLLFYCRRKSNTASCVLKPSSETNCNNTKEEFMTNPCDSKPIQESVETLEVTSKQDYDTINNIKKTDLLGNALEETLPHSSNRCSVNGEVLLEDMLD